MKSDTENGKNGLLAMIAALPKAMSAYRRERLGRLRLLDMDDRLLADLGFTRRQAEAAVDQVRFGRVWRRMARKGERRAFCRNGCPVPPKVMEKGCCGGG